MESTTGVVRRPGDLLRRDLCDVGGELVTAGNPSVIAT